MTGFIRVVAPATLEENFSFDVLLGGKPFTVTVPKGGVRQGEEFEVPYPTDGDGDVERGCNREDDGDHDNAGDDDEDEYFNSQSNLKLPQTMSSNSGDDDDQSTDEHDRFGAPFGRFRVSFCSCCDVLTQATFWMAMCCFPVLVAQLLTRLRLKWTGLDARGRNADEERSMSFNKIVLTFCFFLAMGHLPVIGSVIVFLFYVFVVVYIGGNTRRYMRQRYKIPSRQCCPEWAEDRCVMCCCGCCAVIQMARHTHNDKEYPGYCCTTTGLELEAPEMPVILCGEQTSTNKKK